MKAATKTQAEALNKLILSDPLIQEFKKYEEALKQHPELLALEDEIKEDSQIILKKKALGELTEEEMKKPLVGIVSSYNEIVPGHMNLDKITEAVKMGVAMAGGTPIVPGHRSL